jgi:serine protease inhibitor
MRKSGHIPRLLLTASLAVPVVACGGDPLGPLPGLPRALTSAELRVIDASNTFAFDLLRELVVATDSPNVFISPLSASMAFGMAMNGAQEATWTQMRDVLGFPGMEEPEINRAYRDLTTLLLGLDSSVRFGIANSVWADHSSPLLPDYLDRVRASFGAEARNVDFRDASTMDDMNRWVARATGGRIDRMIESIPRDVLVYLLNAVYFKGDWRNQFDKRRTSPAPFRRADGMDQQVNMMTGEVGYRVFLPTSPDAPAGVELPYSRDAFAAVAILPPEGQSIQEFVAGLDAAVWADWIATIDEAAAKEDTRRDGILIRLPRFQIEWSDSLVAPLQRLGMTDAFDAHRADFSRMTGGRDLFITDAFQKTFLKVDEEGTEAAAATAIGMGPTSAPPSLSFDRPFLFAIRERFSGTILFIGVIGDPRA